MPRLKDRISTESLLKKLGSMSVNKLNAQIKLLEMWKAINIEDYPLNITQQAVLPGGVSTWAAQRGRPIEIGKSNLTKRTSTSDAVRIWNVAPRKYTEAKTLYVAKNAIKGYVKSLPI